MLIVEVIWKIFIEVFVKERVLNDSHSIAYVLAEINEIYSKENGWTIGEPIIIPNPDGKTVTIKVELTKYQKNESRGYSL